MPETLHHPEQLPMQVAMPVIEVVEKPSVANSRYALELVKSTTDFKNSYKDRIRKEVAEGFLPERAIASFRSINGLKMNYIHSISSLSEGMMGLYSPPSFGQRQSVDLMGNLEHDMFEHYFVHELNHALSSNVDNGFDINSEFINIFGVHGCVVMEEAFTEHLAVSMLYGEREVIDPYERSDGKTADSDYVLYRQFLDLLSNGGARHIPIRDSYKALYFGEKGENGGTSDAIGDWMFAVAEAFPGVNVLSELKALEMGDDDGLVRLMDVMKESNNKPDEKKHSRIGKFKARVNSALTKAAVGL